MQNTHVYEQMQSRSTGTRRIGLVPPPPSLPCPALPWHTTPLTTFTKQHAAAYTALLVNHDSNLGRLQAYESYLQPGEAPNLTVQQGDTQGGQATDFLFQYLGGVITINGNGAELLYEANVSGASARFTSLSGSTPWSDGERQGCLLLVLSSGLDAYSFGFGGAQRVLVGGAVQPY